MGSQSKCKTPEDPSAASCSKYLANIQFATQPVKRHLAGSVTNPDQAGYTFRAYNRHMANNLRKTDQSNQAKKVVSAQGNDDTNRMNRLHFDKGLLVSHLQAHKYVYLLLAVTIAFNLNAFADLIHDWHRDDNYSHGFLIIPIAIWLFWRKRRELTFPAKPSPVGMLVFLAGCFGLIVAIAASEFFTTRLSLVLIATGISLYYLGWQNFRKVWFAFFFLLFMIPIPAIIYHAATLPMQLFATKVTATLLQVLGVPAVRQGNIINLPNYSLEVIEACSGLRSLVSLMALGALYAYLFLSGTIRPIILFLLTIPIAIVTNIFRIFVTAIAAYAISTEFAEDFLHELSGMLVFATALVLTLIAGAILKWRRKPSS